VGVPFVRDPTKEDPVEDREKLRPEPEDVEAHKKKTTPVALRGDEAPTPEGESADDDVELHRAKNQSSKL
jgi:hypothetical protein